MAKKCMCICMHACYTLFNWSIFRIFSSYIYIYFSLGHLRKNDGERTSHPNNAEWNAYNRFFDGWARWVRYSSVLLMVSSVFSSCFFLNVWMVNKIQSHCKILRKPEVTSKKEEKKHTHYQKKCENRGTQQPITGRKRKKRETHLLKL